MIQPVVYCLGPLVSLVVVRTALVPTEGFLSFILALPVTTLLGGVLGVAPVASVVYPYTLDRPSTAASTFVRLRLH